MTIAIQNNPIVSDRALGHLEDNNIDTNDGEETETLPPPIDDDDVWDEDVLLPPPDNEELEDSDGSFATSSPSFVNADEDEDEDEDEASAISGEDTTMMMPWSSMSMSMSSNGLDATDVAEIPVVEERRYILIRQKPSISHSVASTDPATPLRMPSSSSSSSSHESISAASAFEHLGVLAPEVFGGTEFEDAKLPPRACDTDAVPIITPQHPPPPPPPPTPTLNTISPLPPLLPSSTPTPTPTPPRTLSPSSESQFHSRQSSPPPPMPIPPPIPPLRLSVEPSAPFEWEVSATTTPRSGETDESILAALVPAHERRALFLEEQRELLETIEQERYHQQASSEMARTITTQEQLLLFRSSQDAERCRADAILARELHMQLEQQQAAAAAAAAAAATRKQHHRPNNTNKAATLTTRISRGLFRARKTHNSN